MSHPHDHANLETLALLSHHYGSEQYVLGGGGNSSFKHADTLWIKPSGCAMNQMEPGTFVAMDRTRVRHCFTHRFSDHPQQREAEVLTMMQAAVRADSTGRPSVETPLHEACDATYVIHTHPAMVNGLTCARDGRVWSQRLFPDACWVGYTDPGLTLSLAVHAMLQDHQRQHGHQPAVLMLENHGVFVAADSEQEIHRYYDHVMQTLARHYRAHGVNLQRPLPQALSSQQTATCTTQARNLFGDQATHVCVSAPFPIPDGPLSPDHIVYARSFPLRCSALTEKAVQAYLDTHGLAPRVIVTDDAVITIGHTQKTASLAMAFACDASLVARLTQAFGQVQFLGEKHRRFIEQWEVESYRASVST